MRPGLLAPWLVISACCTARAPAPEASGAAGGAADAPAANGALGSGGLGTRSGAFGPIGVRGVLLPPSTPGESRWDVAGCAAEAAGGEEATKAYAVAPTRAPLADPVRIGQTGTGIVVHHDVDHACCLAADVTAAVEGSAVRVRETLSGTPCRCVCRSSLRTAIGLAPGSYELTVEVDRSGVVTEAFRQTITRSR